MDLTIAQRVAGRFLKAARGNDPRDVLLHKTEAAVHRSTEMLHAVHQVHGFWVNTIGEGKPFATVEHAYRKVQTMLKTYEHECMEAMGNLEQVEDVERHEHENIIDYPESYER